MILVLLVYLLCRQTVYFGIYLRRLNTRRHVTILWGTINLETNKIQWTQSMDTTAQGKETSSRREGKIMCSRSIRFVCHACCACLNGRLGCLTIDHSSEVFLSGPTTITLLTPFPYRMHVVNKHILIVGLYYFNYNKTYYALYFTKHKLEIQF